MNKISFQNVMSKPSSVLLCLSQYAASGLSRSFLMKLENSSGRTIQTSSYHLLSLCKYWKRIYTNLLAFVQWIDRRTNWWCKLP